MRATLPTGLVTFLFSDIEGSTQRWEQRREAMTLALRRHDRLMRSAIESRNGRVFKTMGDQFCAVFWSAPEAVAAAAHAQAEIARQDWSTIDGLHVRMAVHTGVTDERDGDYFGPAVNRVARLLAIGHGGQILLSGFAADLATEHLPPNSELRDLGAHRLKDLAQAERVYQLVSSDSAHRSPQLRALRAPNNLPAPLTSFLGREAETRAVARLVGEYRLVTLVGTGGVGKTTTAVRVAADLLDSYDDGAWLVELCPVSDPHLVAGAIAAAFGIEDRGDSRPPIEVVCAALRNKHALIVLDNCEHVIEAAAEVAETILLACPNVRILATSREALRIGGEHAYRLPALAVPPAGPIDARTALAYPAVALFVERARSVAQDFVLSDTTAPAVSEIVRQLDGIALAIELAAARAGVLPVEQLATRLNERFALLSSGSRTARPRQQTLRALIDWSYDLLDDAERAFLRRLGIFRGSWTLDAATAVAAGDKPGSALALLSKLIEKSLVVAERDGDDSRYRLLESTRQYVLERLDEFGERAEAARRHCTYYRDLCERACDVFWTVSEDRHAAVLLSEIENYRAAIGWGLTEGNDVASGAIIVANLSTLWLGRFSHEGRALVDRALAAIDPKEHDRIRARLQIVLAYFLIDGALGFEPISEAVATLRKGPDRIRLADALRLLGNSTGRSGRPKGAIPPQEEALAIARSLGLPRLSAAILDWMGFGLAYGGQPAKSRLAFEEALKLEREAGDPGRMPLVNYAEMLFGVGDVRGAIAAGREGLAIKREIGSSVAIMAAAGNLSEYLIANGDLAEAWMMAREALEIALQTDRRMVAAVTMQRLAQIAARQGDAEPAARLIGYIDSVYAQQRHPREPTEQRGYERTMTILKAAYAPARLAALLAEGAALDGTAASAIAFAVRRPAPNVAT